MLIETAAFRIAEGIKRQVPDHKSSVNILKHAIAVILNVVLIIALTLLIAFFTGHMGRAATALIGFALLRQSTGGIHLKTGEWCVLVTTALFTLVSFIELSAFYVQILNVLSMVLVAVFAPSKIENQSRIPRRHYPKLRVIGVLIVLANVLIQSQTLAVVFFVQALSLIHRKEVKRHVTDQQS